MKYKLEHVVEWVVLDALWWMTAILGTFYHHQGWFWVFAFLTWVLFIMWGFISLIKFGAALTKADFPVENRAVPARVAASSDLGIACVMAFTGHFFYATLVILQMLFEQFYFAKEEVKASGN